MRKPDNFILAIDKKLISAMEPESFKGEIIIVETPEQADAAVDYLEQHDLVGFDTETKPSFKKGKPNKVALMQLATDERCFLFRLNRIGVCDAVVRFLENRGITKIGLSIHDDFNVMHRSSEVNPQGFIELQEYVKNYHIADISLQKVYAIIFGKKISKSQCLTNWEAAQLTPAQQAYAATDAWACLKIYRQLSQGLFNPCTSPHRQEND